MLRGINAGVAIRIMVTIAMAYAGSLKSLPALFQGVYYQTMSASRAAVVGTPSGGLERAAVLNGRMARKVCPCFQDD